MTDRIPSSPAIADSALTPERLARLRQVHEAASPGPWAVSPWHDQLVLPERWINVARDEATPEKAGQFTAVNTSRAADAELIAEVRNALPDLLGHVEFGQMMTESYLEASKRFDNLCMDLFRRIASGASLAEVVDLVGDYMDGCDAVDDESIAAFNAAKARAGVSDSENTQ